MSGVIVRKDESIEKALKRFKKSCEKEGIISDMKKNIHYEKPSTKRNKRNSSLKNKRSKNKKSKF